MKKAYELVKLVDKKIANWNERSQFRIKGVGNLSMSDMDSIRYYAETFIRQGNISNLMQPMGGVGEVLSQYGIEKIGW